MVRNAFGAACILLACSPVARAQQPGPVAKWSFEESAPASAHDSVSGADDKILGYFSRVPGVSGSALRFDGMTTAVVRSGLPAAKGARAGMKIEKPLIIYNEDGSYTDEMQSYYGCGSL